MILDARRHDGSRLEADICIVGAGAAGITLAMELAASGHAVLLLESGGLDFDAVTQSLCEGENASFAEFPIEATRLRFLGGSTNHWHGMTHPLIEADLAARPGIAATGWPIGLGEIRPFYRRAQEICQLGRVDFADVEGWQVRAGGHPVRLEDPAIVPAVAHFSPPTRFGSAYRRVLERAPNLRVLLNANAVELVADDGAAHVKAITARCIGGPAFTVVPRVAVLALGGLENARLLLLSRRQQPAGLGNGHDVVGRYYMDHSTIAGGFLQLAPGAPDLRFFLGPSDIGDSRLHGIFVPRPEALVREGIGNFRLQLYPAAAPSPGVESAKALMNFGHDAEIRRNLGRHLANIMGDIDDVADLLYKNVIDRKGFKAPVPAAAGRTALVELSGEQFPNRDSRASLSDRRDLLDQPRLRLDWRVQDIDLHGWRRGMEMFAAAIGAAGLGRVRITGDLLGDGARRIVGISCHHMGTTRMAADPKAGVVDGNCRVHGIDNLYIAGSSVFPTGGWANPTLTIVALAVRLARHIGRQRA